MPDNLFRGNQIRPQTLELSHFVPGMQIPDSYLTNGVNFIKRDGSVAFLGNLSMGNNRITGLAAGITGTDAMTMNQGLALINGIHLHFARAVAATNIVNKSGLPTVDTVVFNPNEILFLIGQNTLSENGPWQVKAGAWTRPADWVSGSTQTDGHYWIIEPDGNVYKNSKWFLANTASVVVDTTNVTFTQDGAAIIQQGAGILVSGSLVSVARGNGIDIDGSNNIVVKPDPARLLQTIAAGVGIKDGASGQLVMANTAGVASYLTLSGDASLAGTGALTINRAPGNGFLKYTDFVASESPSGSLDGTNKIFTLATAPQNNSLMLFKNGLLLLPGPGNQYTQSSVTLTLTVAPVATDTLLAFYFR